MKSITVTVYKDKYNFYETGCEKIIFCGAKIISNAVYLATTDTVLECSVIARAGVPVPSWAPHTIKTMKILTADGYLFIEPIDFPTDCAPDPPPVSGIQSIVEGPGIDVDDTDPLNPIVSAELTNISLKALIDRSLKTYYSAPRNFDTEGVAHITKNGALAVAPVAAVGPYDQYDVTGGDATSYVTFNDIVLSDSASKIVASIKVDSLGTTPRIGIRVQQNASYFQAVSNGNAIVYLKQDTSFINSLIASANYGDRVNYNTGGTPFAIAAGDVIEITLKRYLLEKHGWEAYVVNKSTGVFISAQQYGVQPSNICNNPANVGLILADGKYTILDYSVISQDGEGAKCCILSSLSAVGFNILYGTTIVNYLNEKMVYRNIVLGGMGATINGFARASALEILVLRPQSVAIVDFWTLFNGWFKSGNPGEANFLAKLTQLTTAILSYGGVPLFFKYKSMGSFVSAPDVALWNTWVDTNAATYGAQVVDLTGGPNEVYDGGNFGWAAPYTEYVADAIIAKLTSIGLLP